MVSRKRRRKAAAFPRLGSLSNDDDSSINVAKKINLRPFKLYWTHSICQMWAIFPGVEILETLSGFNERGKLTSYVHVLHQRRIRRCHVVAAAVDVKEIY